MITETHWINYIKERPFNLKIILMMILSFNFGKIENAGIIKVILIDDSNINSFII
jgi:hypothetical protein